MSVSFIRLTLVLAAVLLSTGCAEPLTLTTKSAAVPDGVSFAGNWRLRAGPATPQQAGVLPADDNLERATRPRRPGRSSRSLRNDESSAHVFLEYGESLKITQTRYSLFISYDRSVVEEFTFGENRIESVGPIVAQRVSGWEGGTFVVETLDDTGSTLREAWSLQDGDRVLMRQISLTSDDETRFERTVLYDRQD